MSHEKLRQYSTQMFDFVEIHDGFGFPESYGGENFVEYLISEKS